jgi:hypothetical protein
MSVTLNDAGANVPWRVRRKTDWNKQFIIKQQGEPVDITGHTFEAKVVASETNNTTVIVNLAPVIHSAANGAVRIAVPATSTTLTPGTYWWYLKWTDTTNSDVIALMSGPFTIEAYP